jgi:hypothetical protein
MAFVLAFQCRVIELNDRSAGGILLVQSIAQ